MSDTILFSNNASTTIAGSINSVATTVTLATGTGALFPSPAAGQYFCATFVDAATGLINEIIHVTNLTGDVATIVRGQEGTTAEAWSAGDLFANLLTAGSMNALTQEGTTRIYTGTSPLTITLADRRVVVQMGTPTALTVNLPANAPAGFEVTINDFNGISTTDPFTVVPPSGTISHGAHYVMQNNYQVDTFVKYATTGGLDVWGVE